ncbi:MAG: RNA polymerase sigma-70 factor [Dysgonamonadaceae bacterium]|jgi:RNA polymerase sigma-70 factor (ECF subfamily)|nr:RNA polymerase sigma-70 factor [Dysgonamonadaceae bacterium]
MEISSERLKQLIYELSKNNSQDALKQIYLTFYPKLFRLAIYYVRVKATAEEIVSDTFFSIWQQRSQLLEIHDFNAFVYQITRNISISYLRKQTSSNKNIDSADVDIFFNSAETPESELISAELMRNLNQAIEKLPEKCKLVFKLIREENLKYKEVASMLNISIKTVEAHISMAVLKLRDILKNDLK